MFAVIKTGGKQYRVAKDDVIDIEKLPAEAGETVVFDNVLMVAGDGEPVIGSPLVEGASVAGEVVEQFRTRKIIVFKKRRRKNFRRSKGHRQALTSVRITDILTGGAKPKAAAKAKPKAEEKPKAEKPAKAEAPAKAEEAAVAPLFTAPEGAADDLKKISGVGPVLEKKLNALGITQFAQVAAFTAEDIARVDDALSFKGRIERDDWLGQAAKLAAGE
ncbi:MAG: 50S ribosomal protein L21 [Hyphomicrobiales bacterium]|mgnify:CR=1 FL=1|nr:MAG: 50S ribosomal protein L21 [Hyphomicrobiales bacterium]